MGSRKVALLVWALSVLPSFGYSQLAQLNVDSLTKIAMHFDFNLSRKDSSFDSNSQGMKYFYYDENDLQRKATTVDAKHRIISIMNTDEDGNLDGVGIEIYETGALKTLSLFTHGLGVAYVFGPNAQMVEWYFSWTGRSFIRQQSFYNNGVLYHDSWDLGAIWIDYGYHSNGKLEHRGLMLDNKPVGTWVYYNEQGKRTKTKVFDDTPTPSSITGP